MWLDKWLEKGRVKMRYNFDIPTKISFLTLEQLQSEILGILLEINPVLYHRGWLSAFADTSLRS